MSSAPVCLILAAGKGTRLKSDLPKVLHPVAGRPMLAHVVTAAQALAPLAVAIVHGPDMPAVERAIAPHTPVLQAERLGTGHAVRVARDAGVPFGGPVLVLYGDTPLVRADTLARLTRRLDAADRPALVVAGMRPADPARYGRLVLDADGGLARIVEYRDADDATRAIPLVNAGFMALDGPRVGPLLDHLQAAANGELYLTDLVALARAQGWAVAVEEIAEAEALGANSRAELAQLEAILQARLRAEALEAGVGMVAPETVFLAADTRFGRDVMIEPYVVIGPGVVLGDHVTVRAFSHLVGTRVAAGAVLGPYARLREGTVLGPDTRIGNFVEVKQAELGAGAKVNHLSYVGDASIGAGSNLGAGTITCNYDGVAKHRTVVGARAFIGSNTALVAPVTLGEGVLVAAGSTVTQDAPDDALVFGRARQVTRKGAAALRRARARPAGG